MTSLLAIVMLTAAGPAKVPARRDAPTGLVREGRNHVLYLDGLADAKRWHPAEATVQPAKKLKADGRPTLHLHIPVDHFAGEKRYPIGWPRMYLSLKQPGETAWKDFERFEFLVHAEMSRPAPPKRVLNLQIHCPDKPRVLSRNLEEIRLGKWVRVSIPTRGIPHVADVRRLGLNISESDYRHGEKLDFRIGGFRLVRAAEFGVRSLTVRSRVMFAGRRRLRIECEVAGPPVKAPRELPLTVRRGTETVAAARPLVTTGLHVLDLDIAKWKLPPGRYVLAAFDGDADRRTSATFRVVESPWEGQ
jgi:hypothetical protein